MLNAGRGQDILSNIKNRLGRFSVTHAWYPPLLLKRQSRRTPCFWHHWITWENPLSPLDCRAMQFIPAELKKKLF